MSDTMEEHFANTRQPKPVTITVKGEQEDMQDWFQRLFSFLQARDEAVDFDYLLNGQIVFRVYPRAIND